MFGGKIREMYEKYGLKCVYPFVYALFFALNFLSSAAMKYPAMDPNELSVIAVAQFLTGKSWSGVMGAVDYYYGFLQSALYVPVMLVFKNPQVQYIAVGAVNSLLISLVPLLAMSIARRLGIEKFWKIAAAALISGGYCCYFAHSKFAWTETVTILIPWLVLRLILGLTEQKRKVKLHFYSAVIGVLCGFAAAAHIRLIFLPLIIVIIMVTERIFYGKKTVLIPSFAPAFILSAAAAGLVTRALQQALWGVGDPALLNNTLPDIITGLSKPIENGASRFIGASLGQLYYFITSTWGLGALSFCLFGAVIACCFKKKKAKEPPTYSHGVFILSVFAFFTAVFSALSGVIFRFGDDGFYTYQDNIIFGRFLDSVIPFSLLFVLIILFTSSVKLNKILGSAVICSVIYLAFFIVSVPVILECDFGRLSPVLGLYPLRIGSGGTEPLSFNSLLLTVSAVFSVHAVFVVVISCTKKYRSAVLSAMLSALTVYSLIFIAGTYLPMCRNEAVQKNKAAVEISQSVYNRDGAPPLTLYNLDRHDALMLRFLNTDISVNIIGNLESIQENCFLTVKSGEDVSALVNSRKPFLLIAENSELKIYAYGERAVAYMRSQNVDEAQEALLPISSEKSEGTAASPETTVPASTKAPVKTSFTTERTPIISTYTAPEVVTSHVSDLGDDAEWLEIE